MEIRCKKHPDEVFDNRADFMRHVSTHPSEKVSCPLCGKVVKSRGLKAHMAMEQDPNHPLNRQRFQGRETSAPERQEDVEIDRRDDDQEEPMQSDAAIQSPVNEGVVQAGQGAEAAPIGLKFPGEKAEKIVAPKDVPVAAKAATGGMVRVRGAIMHRTPSLLVSNETMALFEYAAATWPDKYGKGADLADDLSRFVDEVVISFFKIYGIGPVIYRARESLVGATNGNANGATGGSDGNTHLG